jgi:D-alanine-D-alanine ligase
VGAIPVDPLWWQSLFDEVYLITDARSVCNEALTRREVDFLEAHLKIARSDSILDLCGGHGRHSLELARRGYGSATVLDYSEYLVQLGRDKAAEQGLPVGFVQADARRTGLSGERFDFVLVMANSFGYFPDDSDNVQILCEAYRLCRPGGTLLLDLLDSGYVVENFRPSSVHRATEDITVSRERELAENLIRVRETVVSGAQGLLREGTYCERLFRQDEIESMLMEAGFGAIEFKTDFSSHQNPGDYGFMTQRVIVTAVRPSPAAETP